MIYKLLALLILLYPTFVTAEHIDLPLDDDGWTIFTPSVDTRIVYVSEAGDDTACASVPEDCAYDSTVSGGAFTPTSVNSFATISAARLATRDGYPDWILIKRGDTFNEAIEWSNWNGRSVSEPYLISSYGSTGAPPLLKVPPTQYAVRLERNNFALSGVDFYASSRDPDSPDYTSTRGTSGMYASTDSTISSILVEGCKFSYFESNKIQTFGTGDIRYVYLRRNVITDNYSDYDQDDDQGHSMGLWSAYISYMTLDQNIFDHNGYCETCEGSSGATYHQHNVYMTGMFYTTFKDNIFSRAASIGTKLTANTGENSSHHLTFDGNLYLGGEVGIELYGNEDGYHKFKDISVTDNVFSDMGWPQPIDRTLGWGIWMRGWERGYISNNYFINQSDTNISMASAITMSPGTDEFEDVTISGNVSANVVEMTTVELGTGNYVDVVITDNTWSNDLTSDYVSIVSSTYTGTLSISGNTYYTPLADPNNFEINGVDTSFADWKTATGDDSVFEEHTFPDSTRSVETYQSSIGETSTKEAFIDNIRAMDRYSWDTRYETNTVNTWIKKGFKEFRTGQTQSGTGAFTTGTGSLTTQ